MSNILNQDLVNRCIKEINSWKALPLENHINEEGYIDLNIAHHLYVYVLKRVRDEGMEKSELASAIIMELDYWPVAEPYQDNEEYDSSKQVDLIDNHWICPAALGKQFTNTSEGWRELLQWATSQVPNYALQNSLRQVCMWNDPDGDWEKLILMKKSTLILLMRQLVEWVYE